MIGWTGIGRYTHRLLERLQGLDTVNYYVVVLQEVDRGKWVPEAPNFRCVFIAGAAPYSVGEQWALPKLLTSLKPDLAHFTHFTVPLLYNGNYVVTVHDMTLVDFKNYRGGLLGRWVYEVKYAVSRLVLRHAVRNARLVMSPTNYVKDRLASHFHLPPEKFTATLLGVDGLTKTPVAPDDKPETPYLFSLGNSYPHKNLDRLVDGFAASDFCKRGGQLVIAGPEDHFRQQLKLRVAKLGLDGPVRFVGRVSDEELSRLYQQASLYVFPSLSEGFGLPCLEAMMYGLPVLAARATCLPEVCGDAAEYFESGETAELTAKIDELVTRPNRLAEMRAAGYEQIKRFSWKATAEQTLATYRVALREASKEAVADSST